MYNSDTSGRGQAFRNKRSSGRPEQADRRRYEDERKPKSRDNGYKNPIDPNDGKTSPVFQL